MLTPWGQLGLSPSGCPAIYRTAQLINDIKPERPHGPLDVEKAHSAIRRAPIIESLIELVEAYPEEPLHRRHLEWNLAHYASGEERTHIVV